MIKVSKMWWGILEYTKLWLRGVVKKWKKVEKHWSQQ